MSFFDIFSRKHGIATIIQPVIYPTQVPPSTPFDITYTVKNTGNYAGRLWGHLVTNGQELPQSKWIQLLGVNKTVTITYHHVGITTDTLIKIEGGY